MAITRTGLNTGGNTTDASSFNVNITPTAGGVVILDVVWTKGTNPPDAMSGGVPTMTGLTFTSLTSVIFSTIASPTIRLERFIADATGYSSGLQAVTFAFGAVQTGIMFAANQLDTASITPAQATVTNRSDSTTTATCALGSTPAATGYKLAVIAWPGAGGDTLTQGADYSGLLQNPAGISTPSMRIGTEGKIGGDTSGSFGLSVSRAFGAIITEFADTSSGASLGVRGLGFRKRRPATFLGGD